MKQLILFTLIFMVGCSKPDPEPVCQSCEWVTTSNYFEAKLACNGLANDYPKLKETDRTTTFLVCGNDNYVMLKSEESEDNLSPCFEYPATTKVRLVCE